MSASSKWGIASLLRGGSGINGCVLLGTDLFNHSKGLFFNRALDKFSECQYNMSFHVRKWPDISNCWSDIPSKKEAKKKE